MFKYKEQFKKILVSIAVGCTALVGHAAYAQFPDRPIKMIVPWPPGGGSDVLGRIVSKHLSQQLGQPVVVDNRPGATGLIGTDALVKSPPDGYTLVFIADSYIVSPILTPATARYDVNKDFTNIGMVGFFPFVLVVNAEKNPGGLKAFLERAKSSSSNVTYSSWGIGSSSHLAMEMFRSKTNANMLHVPFQGAAPAMNAVVAGNVDALFVPAVVALPHHRSGKATILGVSSTNRLPAAPELLTLAEQGVESWISWMGVLGPAGIPADRAQKLTDALKAVITNPEVRAELIKSGLDPNFIGPKELTSFVAGEDKRIRELVKSANIAQ